MDKICIRIIFVLIIILLFNSCAIVGIHTKVHNPRRTHAFAEVPLEQKVTGTLNAYRACYDVTYYGLDLFIDARERSLSGWVQINARLDSIADSLQIDLDQNLTIDALRWNSRDGDSISFQRNLRAINFKTNPALRKGDVFTIHVRYHGKPVVARKPPWSGGTVWKKDKEKNDWLGVACESEGASIWFPCKDHTSDEPDSATMRFTIPDNGLKAVSNGKLIHEEVSDGLRSFTWKVHYPINSYNITYYVGNFDSIYDWYVNAKGDTLHLQHYVLKPNVEKARGHFAKVKEQIRVYEEIYGLYAFYKDGFKLIESPYAGMEHQSAIAYGSKFKNDLYGLEDYIMLHEAGHEWFGNAVSASDLADVWLQEGITTYGEGLYLERKYNRQLSTRHLFVHRLFIKNKRPMVGPVNQRYFDYKDSDVYMKGAWTLHSLRGVINDDTVFFRILRTFYEEKKLKLTTSAEFIKTVNRISGSDYSWFFNQYLYQSKVPFLEYIVKDNVLYYRWKDANPDFNRLPVSVRHGNEHFIIVPSAEIKKFTLPLHSDGELSFDNMQALFGLDKNKQLYK
jgi:aminopeptidase N